MSQKGCCVFFGEISNAGIWCMTRKSQTCKPTTDIFHFVVMLLYVNDMAGLQLERFCTDFTAAALIHYYYVATPLI